MSGMSTVMLASLSLLCFMLGGSWAHESSEPVKRSHEQSLVGLLLDQAVKLNNQEHKLQKLAEKVQDQAKEDRKQDLQIKALIQEVFSLRSPVNKTQVAFTARYDNINTNLNVGSGGTLKYPIVVTNVGNGYNPNTGHFTAPYAGTYAFYATLRSTNDQDWIDLGIMQGNRLLIRINAEGKNDLWDRGVGFATVHLQKGDHVYVKQTAGGTYLEQGYLTNFSGMLLAAD